MEASYDVYFEESSWKIFVLAKRIPASSPWNPLYLRADLEINSEKM